MSSDESFPGRAESIKAGSAAEARLPGSGVASMARSNPRRPENERAPKRLRAPTQCQLGRDNDVVFDNSLSVIHRSQ
jgi:hypothetical protein